MTNPNLFPLIETLTRGINEAVTLLSEKGEKIAVQFSDVLVPTINEEITTTIEGVKQDTEETWAEFLEKIKDAPSPTNIVAVDIELLSSQKLLEIAKQNIVKGSNEVYAMKKTKGDNIFVYLAYGKDKVPFEREHNTYVVIKAEALKSDVLNLFSETKDDLVILK